MIGIFAGCKKLSYLPDISKWNIQKVIIMTANKNLFQFLDRNNDIDSLIDPSKWDCKNVINFYNISELGIFHDCESLSSLPDISKWNIQNVNDISYMFSNCKSLSSLPDISKWNTQNVNDMSGIFSNCKSLSFLPDISKWNTEKATNMNSIFSNCESL